MSPAFQSVGPNLTCHLRFQNYSFLRSQISRSHESRNVRRFHVEKNIVNEIVVDNNHMNLMEINSDISEINEGQAINANFQNQNWEDNKIDSEEGMDIDYYLANSNEVNPANVENDLEEDSGDGEFESDSNDDDDDADDNDDDNSNNVKKKASAKFLLQFQSLLFQKVL